jgi:hypothetical protein
MGGSHESANRYGGSILDSGHGFIGSAKQLVRPICHSAPNQRMNPRGNSVQRWKSERVEK